MCSVGDGLTGNTVLKDDNATKSANSNADRAPSELVNLEIGVTGPEAETCRYSGSLAGSTVGDPTAGSAGRHQPELRSGARA
jgi:hypothetical protein